MKYDKRTIMKRAWEIRKNDQSRAFGSCLKEAWAEAKGVERKITKSEIIIKLNLVAAEANAPQNGYFYTVKINDWTNYGKDRTYFSIVETREGSKHRKEKKYGFFDNISGEYVVTKYDGSLEFTFSGARMA